MVTVAAERGYLRETGNLIFHAALVVLLAGIAAGRLWGYQGTVLVTEGEAGICNAVPLYDSFRPGRLVDGSGLAPFCIDRLDDFTATYEPGRDAVASSAPTSPTRWATTGQPRRYALKVNEPLRVDGVRVYLVSHGFCAALHGPDAGRQGRARTSPRRSCRRTGRCCREGAVKLLDEVRPQLALYGLFAPLAVDPGDGTDPVRVAAAGGSGRGGRGLPRRPRAWTAASRSRSTASTSGRWTAVR